VWAVLAISGIGILAYIICWIVIDEGPLAAPVAAAAPIVAPAASTRRLRRSATDAKWAGVCGGIAAHLGVDSTVVRLIWVVLSIFLGAIVGGLIVYVVMWMVMPPPEPASAASNQPIAHSS
jgi:phage shock protein C